MAHFFSNMSHATPTLHAPSDISIVFKQRRGNQVLHIECFNQSIHYFEALYDNFPHQHDFFELLFVLEGEVMNYIEDTSILYKAGDGCLMNRYITHYEWQADNSTVIFINLSQAMIDSLLQELHHLHIPLTDLKRFYLEFSSREHSTVHTLTQLMDQLQQMLLSTQLSAPYFQKAFIVTLLENLVHASHITTQLINLDLSKSTLLVERAKRFIQRFNGQITREDIAQHLNYNSDYLNRLFKKEEGISLMQYAQNMRLHSILSLLDTTDLSIKQIAELSGFQQESHFFNFFKKMTGQTPRSYQKNRNK